MGEVGEMVKRYLNKQNEKIRAAIWLMNWQRLLQIGVRANISDLSNPAPDFTLLSTHNG